MILGFTGSRYGLSIAQRCDLERMLRIATEFHHGDCVGGDEQAHNLARAYGVPIVIHPPDDPRLRAYCQDAKLVHTPRPYLQRNREIVQACEHLVAAPDGPERLRSGTWATVRIARRLGKQVTILGHMLYEL